MTFKRITSAVLVLIMIFSTCIVSITAEDTLPFTDVKKNWSYEPIKYVYETGLMNGTGDGTKFSPDMNLSRGMVVTVLYRNDGSPQAAYKDIFLDVPDGKYYSVAAVWAYQNGIVTGTGTDEWGEPYFSPNNNITRQELATMFARYAAYKHVDTKVKNADITSYPDSDKVAKWATDAVKWAVGTGLITGKGSGSTATLSPKDTASRAEFATIIYRFCTADFDYEHFYSSPKAISTYTEPDYPLVKDADIYVAVDGNDNNDGSFKKPLATLEAAVKAVRKMDKTKSDGITVAFMAGRYKAPENLVLTAEDSGTADCPITYCAYGDGPVEFNAGVVLPLDQFEDISDTEKEMFADDYEDGIKRIDLTKFGVDANSLSNNNAVFAGDARIDIARWPNKRSDGNDNFINRSYTTRISGADGTISFMSNVKNRLDSYSNIENMYMYGYYRYDWSASDGKIKWYDSETGTVAPEINGYGLYDNHDEYAGHPNPYFYFYNIPEELDRTDEYYIDNTTGTLYVYKPTTSYAISLTGLMMNLSGVEHVTFKKLEFSYGTNRVASIQGNYIEFNMCKFSHMQEYGMSLYGDNNKVYGCEFIDIGSRVIEIGSGDRETLTKGNSVIENCLFDGFGAVVKTGSSAVNARGCGITISHNEMCNGPHSAIFYSEYIWASNYITIEYNYIHDVGIQTSDAGAIYGGRNPAGHGTVIRYNIVADVGRRNNNHNSLGIYLDDGMAGQEIYGNIFYNTANHSVFVNSGRENSIHDNIMISTFDEEITQVNIGDWNIDPEDKHLPIDTEWVMILELVPFRNELWSEKFPTLAKVLYDATNPDPSPYVDNPDYLRYPAYNSVYDNTVITTQKRIDNKDGLSIYTDSAVKFATVIEDFTTYNLETNPGFAEPATGNYTITEGSSLCKIPFDKIGRY